MTAQIINFAERRQQLQLRRNPFQAPTTAFWSLFAAYLLLGTVSYGLLVYSIDSK